VEQSICHEGITFGKQMLDGKCDARIPVRKLGQPLQWYLVADVAAWGLEGGASFRS
jgi:hypothetical protein